MREAERFELGVILEEKLEADSALYDVSEMQTAKLKNGY